MPRLRPSLLRSGLTPALLLAGVLVLAALPGCSSSRGGTGQMDIRQQGEASYYGEKYAGRTTASGEAFDPEAMTAAHRTLPFGTRVRVTRIDTGESVVVRINDRGPYKDNRIIDLSRGAARKIGMIQDGVVEVRIAPAGSPEQEEDDTSSGGTSW